MVLVASADVIEQFAQIALVGTDRREHRVLERLEGVCPGRGLRCHHNGEQLPVMALFVEVLQIQRVVKRLITCRCWVATFTDLELQDEDKSLREQNSINAFPHTRDRVFQEYMASMDSRELTL